MQLLTFYKLRPDDSWGIPAVLSANVYKTIEVCCTPISRRLVLTPGSVRHAYYLFLFDTSV